MREAPERPARPGPVEHRDLELAGPQHPVLAVGLRAEHRDGHLDDIGKAHAGPPLRAQPLREVLGLTAHHDVAVLVGDRAVVGEPVDLVVVRRPADLGDDELDLQRLGLGGEHGAEGLRVRVGQGRAR